MSPEATATRAGTIGGSWAGQGGLVGAATGVTDPAPPTQCTLDLPSRGAGRMIGAGRRMARDQSSALLPSPHILTIFGSKRLTISTRSDCAAITSSISL